MTDQIPAGARVSHYLHGQGTVEPTTPWTPIATRVRFDGGRFIRTVAKTNLKVLSLPETELR